MERGLMRLDGKVLLVALLAALCLACSNLNIKKPTSSKTNTTSTTADAPQRPVEKRASRARFFRVSDRGLGRELGGNEVVLPGDRLELELLYPQAVPFDAKSGLALRFLLKSGGRERSLTWLFKLAVPGGSASRSHRLVRVLGQRDVETLLANFDSSGLIEMSVVAAGLEKLIVEPLQELALTMPAQQSWPLRLAGRAADPGEEAGFPLLLEHGKPTIELSEVTLKVRRKGSTEELSFQVNGSSAPPEGYRLGQTTPASLKLYIPSNPPSNPPANQLENFPYDAEFEAILTAGTGGEVAMASFQPALLLSLTAAHPEAPLTAYLLGSEVIIQATVNKPLQLGSGLRLTLDNDDTVDLVLDASQKQLSASYRVQAESSVTELKIKSAQAINWKNQVDGVLLDRPAKINSFAIRLDSKAPKLLSNMIVRTSAPAALTATNPLKMGETATVYFWFDESVQVTQSQFSSGEKGTLAWSTSPEQFRANYSLIFTPPSSYRGNVHFSLPKEAYRDQAGNLGVDNLTNSLPVDTWLDISQVSISPASGTTIGSGSEVEIVVRFNREVIISGIPTISFTIGSGDGSNREARYDPSRRTGNDAVAVFTYRVGSADSGDLEVSNAASISLKDGASIQDRQGGAVFSPPLLKGGARGARVDNQAAGVTAVDFSPAFHDLPRRSGFVDITLTFSAPVRVVGSPSIAFIMGSGEGISKTATYDSTATGALNDPAKLLFRYRVEDRDNGALRIAAGTSIVLGLGGSISNAGSSNTTPPQLALGGERYAGSVDTLAPTISGVGFSPAAASQVGRGGKVDIIVTFSEKVRVVNPVSNFPQIPFLIGSSSRRAICYGGGDNNELVFSYLVQADDGGIITIAAGSRIELGESGSSISDLVGNAADAATQVLSATSGGSVDTTAPTISGVEFSPAAGSQVRQGGNVDITVTFSEPMRVVNSGAAAPKIPFLMGSGEGASETATYDSAATGVLNDPKKVLFRYEVQDGDTGALSIAAAASIELGASGSSISDLAGNAAELVVLTATSGGTVDGVLPTVNSVIITPELGASVGSYDSVADTIAGEILISVTYSKAITVEGKPHIPFLIDNNPRNAIYREGSGSTTLVFRYPLALGDKGDVSIAAATSIALGAGGSMKDAVANPASTSLALDAAKVGGRVYLGPMVTAIDITPASADYVEREGVIVIAVTFDEAVAVTGTPTLPFSICGIGDICDETTALLANYHASRTAARNQAEVLVFTYTVDAGAAPDPSGEIFLWGEIRLPEKATIQSRGSSSQQAVRRFAKVSGGRVATTPDLAPADNAPAAQDGYVFDVSSNKDGSSSAKAIGVQWHSANGANVDFVAGSMLRLDTLVQQTVASDLIYQPVGSDSSSVALTDNDAIAVGFQHVLAVGRLTLKITPATSSQSKKPLFFVLKVFPSVLSPTILDSSLQVSNLLTGASWSYSYNGGSSWIDVAAASTSVSLPAGVYSETALRRLRVKQQVGDFLSAAAALPESALSHTFVVGTAPSTSYRALRIADSKGLAQNDNRVVLPPELAAQSVAFWARSHTSSGFNMIFSARATMDVQLFYQGDELFFWRDEGNNAGGVSMAQATPLNWHHYLVVKSGTTVSFFRDGQPLWAENALNVAAKFTDNAIHKIVFGNDDRNPSKHENWTRQFNGLIKGIQLWDKTFDAAAARELYNEGPALPSDISKLVAFYPLQGETMSDVVAGGQSLPAIEFNVDNLYAAGMVGATVVDGRPSVPLSAVNASVKVAVGQTSYQLSRDLLSGIPAGATISWSWVKPSSGATSGTVTLTGGESPTLSTTVADGAVQVSATSSSTHNYWGGTVTFIVTFFATKRASTLTVAPSATGTTSGYVFITSSDKDGSSAARAIAVQTNNLSITGGSALRLDTLVSVANADTLSYRSVVGGQESNPLVDADTRLEGFQYTPTAGGMAIFKVSDPGNDWVEEKALYFCVLVNPTTFFPMVSSGQVGVSGLLDSSSSWQYSFDGGSSWSAEIARATTSVALPNGVYSKTALSRLRVRQQAAGVFGSAVALSTEALNAAPTFVEGPAPSTSDRALRIAHSKAQEQNLNRVVLPPELAAQSVAFWARSHTSSGFNVLFGARAAVDIQLFYENDKLVFWRDEGNNAGGVSMAQATPLNWHHYLVVKSGTTVSFFRDGQPLWAENALNVAAKFTDNAIHKIVFGNDDRNPNDHNRNWTRQFNGLIKGIQLWDKTFDAAAARELYNEGPALPSDISKLVAFYPFDRNLDAAPNYQLADAVAGGQNLGAIDFNADNLYAAGMVGTALEDGRTLAPLIAVNASVKVAVGQTSYQLSRDLLSGIPAGATISWSKELPNSGATTGTVTLTEGESPTLSTTVANGAVQVSATSSSTHNYWGGTVTFIVTFFATKRASTLTVAPSATGTTSGYVFITSSDKDGSSAARAIAVQTNNLSITGGSALRLDTLVSVANADTLSYRSVVGTQESDPLDDADTRLAGFQYTPTAGGMAIFKVSDPGNDWVEEKALYFCVLVNPTTFFPTVSSGQVGVSGLLDSSSSWQYSFDGGSSWSAEIARATTSVVPPNGVYSKTALSRLRVRQQAAGVFGSAVALSTEALNAAPTFVAGPAPSTSVKALRVASSEALDQKNNRVVLPAELSAQSVAFWARALSVPTTDVTMLLSPHDFGGFQLYYKRKNASINLGLHSQSDGMEKSYVMTESTTESPFNWHHFLVVREGALVVVYLDGVKVPGLEGATTGNMSKLVFGNDYRDAGGHSNWPRRFNGLIKGIQLWDKTFDAAGALALYSRGRALSSDVSQLVAFYPLQGETMSDVVAGGQSLGAISFDASNLYAAGMVGATVEDGRFPSPLKAKLDTVRVIVGQTNFWLIRELLGGIPTGATIRWSQTLPSSGATTGTVTLTGDGESPTLSTTVADGAVQVSATSSVTDDYLAGTATFKVYFSRHTSSLAHAPNASGNNAGYVFDVSNNKDGSSADRAIVVRGHKLSLTAGITVRLDTLVSGVVGALSYRSVVGGGESNPFVDADTQLAGFQYDTPASVAAVIFKVSDAGTATQEGKALYFRLPLGPAILTPVVRHRQVGVSGLLGSYWYYSFDGGNSWSDKLSSATRRVALPNGVYSKTALSRLRVRQKENNIYSSPVALSAEALAAAPTFVVGTPPSTGPSSWRIASRAGSEQNWNRLVLPPELTAQSVAFWAHYEAAPTGDLGMIFSAREAIDVQLFYQGDKLVFWRDLADVNIRIVDALTLWQHYLVVKSGTTVVTYLNGQKWAEHNLASEFANWAIHKIVFGNDHRNPQAHGNLQRQFYGLIRGIQLWDKTFDAAGARELHNLGGALPDDISQLKAFYPLQETPVKDMVAGGPPLGGIIFDGANPYAPGIVGGQLVR